MVIHWRTILLALAVVVVAVGVVIFVEPSARWLALVVAGAGFGILVVLNMVSPPRIDQPGPPEDDEIDKISETRRLELIRGTSLSLREMKYRYSIRPDPAAGGDRRAFTAEVNTVRLGFVPVLITDNTTDRQGYGYVAFVYDGQRWRGPGLPCPSGQAEAVRHAARCVSPLATEEETSF